MNKLLIQQWLDLYGAAWERGDPDELVCLFSQTAVYRETPFDDPMVGSAVIRQYWQEGAADAQENVKFTSQVWTVDGSKAVAGWQASFTRIPSGQTVELDGVFRLEFRETGSEIKCIRLEEWWHRRES